MSVSKRTIFSVLTALLFVPTLMACGDDEIECEQQSDCQLTTSTGSKYGCCIDHVCKTEEADCGKLSLQAEPEPMQSIQLAQR